jgi:hypothetical protein
LGSAIIYQEADVVKCILPERTALCGEILRAWHYALHPSIHPTHIFLQIGHHRHTEEINIDLQLQDCEILLNMALSIAA